jgi:hypothetical protein
VDLDGDGSKDLLSGSWPGEIYLFAGRAEGGFAKPVAVTGADGAPLKASRASAPFAVDWDGDADLDLVVGDVEGRVHLFANGSGGKGLAFGAPTLLRAGESDIAAPMGDSGPAVADWDGDGRHDLLLGAGDGSVRWFRDLSASGPPVLGSGEVLVAGRTDHEPATEDRPPAPGTRSKVCVADWNADGRPDLLVGDFCMAQGPEPTLTEEQKAEKARLVKSLEELQPKQAEVFERIRKGLIESGLSEGSEEFWTKFSEISGNDEAWIAAQEEMQAIFEGLEPFQPSHSTHGRVWVYLRRVVEIVPPPPAGPAGTPATAPPPVRCR